jgi:hypothetical protein
MSSRQFHDIFLFSVIICILFILTGSAAASEAEITNIVIKNSRDDLVIDLKLKAYLPKK